jgi:CRISPR-associated protein Csm2
MPNGKKFHDGGRPGPSMPPETLKKIVVEGDAATLNEEANKLGEDYYRGGLSSSQIRNILDKLQRMKSYDPNGLQLLRPLLAYAAGRHKGKVLELQRVVDRAIQMVKDESQFTNFKNFFEARVAYHRYHGGK